MSTVTFDAFMTGTVSETTVALESSLEEGVRLAGVSVNAATSVAEDLPPEETKETDQSGPLRPPINASGSNNAASGNLSHPKRFSAVNINKKFLEQNSSVSGSGQPSSNSVVAKSGVAVGEWPAPMRRIGYNIERTSETDCPAVNNAFTSGDH